jgi:hypothetical protein
MKDGHENFRDWIFHGQWVPGRLLRDNLLYYTTIERPSMGFEEFCEKYYARLLRIESFDSIQFNSGQPWW